MFTKGEYIQLPDKRIAKIRGVYDGIPDLYIVCYVNWGGTIGYTTAEELSRGRRMSLNEWKEYCKEYM